MLIPEFSENKENSMLLFFEVGTKNINSMFDELERTYVSFTKMSKTVKDGKVYAVVEIQNDEM